MIVLHNLHFIKLGAVPGMIRGRSDYRFEYEYHDTKVRLIYIFLLLFWSSRIRDFDWSDRRCGILICEKNNPFQRTDRVGPVKRNKNEQALLSCAALP